MRTAKQQSGPGDLEVLASRSQATRRAGGAGGSFRALIEERFFIPVARGEILAILVGPDDCPEVVPGARLVFINETSGLVAREVVCTGCHRVRLDLRAGSAIILDDHSSCVDVWDRAEFDLFARRVGHENGNGLKHWYRPDLQVERVRLTWQPDPLVRGDDFASAADRSPTGGWWPGAGEWGGIDG